MIKITTNFDSKKFMRDIEKEVHKSAEKQVRRNLSDLTAKGLKIESSSTSGKFELKLKGSEQAIEEAVRRIS